MSVGKKILAVVLSALLLVVGSGAVYLFNIRSSISGASIDDSAVSVNKYLNHDVIKAVLDDFIASWNVEAQDESSWFNDMKALGTRHNFCDDRKVYKKNPADYNGWYADCISIIRIAICASTQSPKLFDVLKILGKEEAARRVEAVKAAL